MKKSVKKSAFETLSFQKVTNIKPGNISRFEVVEGSNTVFSQKELAGITKCVLRNTTNLNGRTSLTLLIEAKVDKSTYRKWITLDGISYKRYKGNVNCDIDPSKVCIYKMYDPEEEYGKEENDFSWYVCRIKNDAVTGDNAVISDDELFGE